MLGAVMTTYSEMVPEGRTREPEALTAKILRLGCKHGRNALFQLQ